MISNLEWLQQWYNGKCDGYWEHICGVHIFNIDNPGWVVEIEVSNDKEEHFEFLDASYDNGEDDWIICSFDDGKFIGRGDSLKLDEIIGVFRKCIKGCDYGRSIGNMEKSR